MKKTAGRHANTPGTHHMVIFERICSSRANYTVTVFIHGTLAPTLERLCPVVSGHSKVIDFLPFVLASWTSENTKAGSVNEMSI